MKLTVDEIIEKLENYLPTTERDLMVDCELPLKFLGEGAYRITYSVVGTDMVVKIPSKQKIVNDDNTESPSYCVSHALHELRSISRIKRKNSKFKFLQPYLPEIYFTDENTGVILMKRYFGIGSNKYRNLIEQLEEKVREVSYCDYSDIDNSGNFGVDRQGKLKLIDFGCFDGG